MNFQAGLFSASLTSFITDKIRGLQADPAQQMVYYNQQTVALLAQISQQLSALTPQIPIRPLPRHLTLPLVHLLPMSELMPIGS
jgi:hypothetical protein